MILSDFRFPTISTAASEPSYIWRYNLPNTDRLTYGTEEVLQHSATIEATILYAMGIFLRYPAMCGFCTLTAATYFLITNP